MEVASAIGNQFSPSVFRHADPEQDIQTNYQNRSQRQRRRKYRGESIRHMAKESRHHLHTQPKNQRNAHRKGTAYVQQARSDDLEAAHNHETRNIYSTAPITGTGMIEKVAASLGQNASAMTNNPVGNAMTRLVAPVAIVSPTLLENVDCPTPPPKPARVVQIAPARMPPDTDFMLVRFQFASLVFWQSVRSPVLFSVEQRPAMRNGSKREKRNANPPPSTRAGNESRGAANAMRASWEDRTPIAAAAV